jgi:hypothetical protein
MLNMIYYGVGSFRHSTHRKEVKPMFSKKTKLLGVLIPVCLAAIMILPAFAAVPAMGCSASPANTGDREAKMLASAQNLTTSLQEKGVDVTNLNAALANAQNALQSSNSTAFMDAMKTFHQEIQAGIKDGSINQSDLPQSRQIQSGQIYPMRNHSFAFPKNHVKNNSSGTST